MTLARLSSHSFPISQNSSIHLPHSHHSPQPSSFPPPPPPPPFFIALVPIELGFPAAVVSFPASPKESQKSCLSGTCFALPAPPLLPPPPPPLPSPAPSTKLLNFSAAPFVPVWMFLAACAAVTRAWAAMSDSAIYTNALISMPRATKDKYKLQKVKEKRHTFCAVGCI